MAGDVSERPSTDERPPDLSFGGPPLAPRAAPGLGNGASSVVLSFLSYK